MPACLLSLIPSTLLLLPELLSTHSVSLGEQQVLISQLLFPGLCLLSAMCMSHLFIQIQPTGRVIKTIIAPNWRLILHLHPKTIVQLFFGCQCFTCLRQKLSNVLAWRNKFLFWGKKHPSKWWEKHYKIRKTCQAVINSVLVIYALQF